MELITAVYDTPQYFPQWLDSVKDAGFSRIVVGVDGVESTLVRIAPFCQGVAEVYYTVGHVGIPTMLNSLIALSTDKYVVKIDADDVARRDVLKSLVSNFKEFDGVSALLFRCRNFGQENMSIGPVGAESYPSAGVYNVKDVISLGGFSTLMPTLSDTDYFYRLRAVGKGIKKTTEVVVDRRLHGCNFSEVSQSKYAEQQYLNKALLLYNTQNSKIPFITTELKRLI